MFKFVTSAVVALLFTTTTYANQPKLHPDIIASTLFEGERGVWRAGEDGSWFIISIWQNGGRQKYFRLDYIHDETEPYIEVQLSCESEKALRYAKLKVREYWQHALTCNGIHAPYDGNELYRDLNFADIREAVTIAPSTVRDAFMEIYGRK